MSRNQKTKLVLHWDISGQMEICHCIIHDTQALKTIASKMLNSKLSK